MSKLRMAIIYKTDEVYVEFTPEQFSTLLKDYVRENNNLRSVDKRIDKALTALEFDLKKRTLYT